MNNTSFHDKVNASAGNSMSQPSQMTGKNFHEKNLKHEDIKIKLS